VVGRALDMASPARPDDPARWPRIYLSPRGAPFTQAHAERFAQAEGVTLLCGRFEGVDQRVIDHYALEEVSLGDFVLTGGEIAAQAMLDATVRLIPGVLGNAASTEDESFPTGFWNIRNTPNRGSGAGMASRRSAFRQPGAEIAKWRRSRPGARALG
jgi:tRNA (guanine37-N1)-methyltransferase